MSALLEIEGLHAGYGDHEILRGVGLRVEAGEIVAIIGPNGAGKSTLLKTIAGLLSPREGAVRFRGEPIAGAPPELIIRRGLCYVPQETNVFPGLSVEDNLVIGGWAAAGENLSRAAAVSALFPVLAERRRQRAARFRAASARCWRSRWRSWSSPPSSCWTSRRRGCRRRSSG